MLLDSPRDSRNRFLDSYEIYSLDAKSTCKKVILELETDIPESGLQNPLAHDGVVSLGDIQWGTLGIKFVAGNDTLLETGVYILPKFESHAHRNDGVTTIYTNLIAGIKLADVNTKVIRKNNQYVYQIEFDKTVLSYKSGDTVFLTPECGNDIITGELKVNTSCSSSTGVFANHATQKPVNQFAIYPSSTSELMTNHPVLNINYIRPEKTIDNGGVGGASAWEVQQQGYKYPVNNMGTDPSLFISMMLLGLSFFVKLNNN